METRQAWKKRNLEGGTIYAVKVRGTEIWLMRGLSITGVVGFVVLAEKLPGTIQVTAARRDLVPPPGVAGGADDEGRRVVAGLIEEAGRGKWWVQRQHEAGKCGPACAICYQKEKATAGLEAAPGGEPVAAAVRTGEPTLPSYLGGGTADHEEPAGVLGL